MSGRRNLNPYVWIVFSKTEIGLSIIGVFDSEERAEKIAVGYMRETPVMIEKHFVDQGMRKPPRETVDEWSARKGKTNG